MYRSVMSSSVRNDLKLIFETSVNAVKPDALIKNFISFTENELIVRNDSKEAEKKFLLKNRDIYILGAGKAVLKMCEEFLKQLDLKNNSLICNKLLIKSGILSVPMGSHISDELFDKYNVKYKTGALNNMPDINSQNTTLEIVDLIRNIKRRTMSSEVPLIISFISGGGSALLSLPKPNISLDQKCSLIAKLVKSGATINDLNTVRRCLSQVKCGKIANMALKEPNSVELISFIISDIINDPIEMIASGPTVICKPEKVKPSEKAFSILKKYNIQSDENIKNSISSEDSELNLDYDKIVNNKLTNIVIGNNTIALNVAQNTANKLGYKVVYLGNHINGEASGVARKWAQIVMNYKESEEDLNNFKGICWIGGGETTVTMNNSQIGLGGRCQEMGLAFYQTVYNHKCNGKLYLLCAGTDGQDGPTTVAGVIVENISHSEDPNEELFKKSKTHLINHNSHNFFRNNHFDWFIDTNGVTGTNVMDIYCMIKSFNKN